jgi:hypothetical protein
MGAGRAPVGSLAYVPVPAQLACDHACWVDRLVGRRRVTVIFVSGSPQYGQDQKVAVRVVVDLSVASETATGINVANRPSPSRFRYMIEAMSLPVHPLAGQRVGCARISSASQNLDGHTDALNAAGCEKVFADTASGKLTERPPGYALRVIPCCAGRVSVRYALARTQSHLRSSGSGGHESRSGVGSFSATMRANSTRDAMSSLAKIRRRWVETVCGDRNIRVAACRLVIP